MVVWKVHRLRRVPVKHFLWKNARSFGGRKRKGVTPTVSRPSPESLNLIESLISLSRIGGEVANWLTGAIGFISRNFSRSAKVEPGVSLGSTKPN